MWIIVFIGIAVFIFILDHFMPSTDFNEVCKQECNNFDMDFYKIYRGGSIECWCLNDGKPYSIGKVYEK